MNNIGYIINYDMFIEDDGSVTLSLNEFDIVVNGESNEKALELLMLDLKEYLCEYKQDEEFWSRDINRKKSIKRLLEYLNSDNL